MALTASFTSHPVSGVAVSRDFHVVLEFSSAIDPATLAGSDFRLRSQLGSFHNPSNDQVEFYTDDNITFLVVFHFTGNLGGSQQYLVRLPMNRIEYVDENGITQNGPDATINTPLFNIDVSQELTATITYSDSEGAAGTATIATILFNQPVSGVDISDFSIADGTLGDLTVVSSSRYTVPVTPSASGDGTLTLTFAEDGTYEGNPEAPADLPYTGGGTPQPVNNAPAFGESSYSFSDIAIAVNTVVGSVVATDEDDDTLSYSLTGTDASNFAIDSDGEITVATALINSTTYNFNVVADDQTDTASVAVTVIAIAATPVNNAPSFQDASYAFTDVAIAVNTVVGTVAATDADNDTLSYSLTGTDAGNFSIDADGQITVATALINSTTYNFNVVADDQTDTASVAVTVIAIAATPVNNAPSFQDASYAFTDVAIAVNTVVGTVAATDADNDTLSYSLTGTDASNFAIDSDGEITVATALINSTTYNFNVVADDQTDTASVAVTVIAIAATPVNNAPSFQDASYAFTDVAIAVNTVVGTVAATDADNDTLSYSLTGTDAGNFSIDADGQITVATELTHSDTYSFNVVADDATDTTSVPVTVTATAAAPPPVVITLTGAPTGLKVELTPTTALLKWAAATDGGDADEYEVNVAEGASLGSTWIGTGSTGTRFFVKRLKRGTQYTFGVRGRNSEGAGEASSPVTQNTPIASLHNALFFKECVNYFDDGARVSVHGNPSELVRAVADNNYKTFTREKDLVINIAVGGNPTRVDAIFVKGQDIEGHSAEPTGGTGSGYSNRMMPATVKNWEGTEVSTVVAGFQHDLYLLDPHFTATSVRLTFTGADAKIVEIMLLEFGLEIDANADFTQINPDFVDRTGVVHPDAGDGIAYSPSIGDGRDKWQVDYVVRVVPGKTLLETPEDFLYWRSDNRNHVHAMEPSRFPLRIFPSVFMRKSVPIRYRTDSKTSGEILSFRVAEQ